CCLCVYLGLISEFFFSSRRRHTRFSRDWSSDVCSSDLGFCLRAGTKNLRGKPQPGETEFMEKPQKNFPGKTAQRHPNLHGNILRSEERRVGKECRSRDALTHAKQRGYNRKISNVRLSRE